MKVLQTDEWRICMKFKHMCFVLAALSLCAVADRAVALPITTGTTSGQVFSTTSITSADATGSSMLGMSVTAIFGNGSASVMTWSDLGSGVFGVSNNDWSLTINPNTSTFNSIWTLDVGADSNFSITELTISGLGGNTVFDIFPSPETTDGSALGKPINVGTSTNLNLSLVSAMYSNAVAINGQAPLGDLYESLTITFGNQGGFGSGDTFRFQTDTDNVDTRLNPVPEPATMLLFGTGIIGLAAFRRNRR